VQVLPLAYWIVFNSCVAYGLITFGNKHASASSVLAYTALQPVATALLSWVLVVLGPGASSPAQPSPVQSTRERPTPAAAPWPFNPARPSSSTKRRLWGLAATLAAASAVAPAASAVAPAAGKTYGLAEPGWNALGGIGVLIGLGFVVYDISRTEAAAAAAAAVANRTGGSGSGSLSKGLLQ
jgi:hypothetical protein